MRQWSEEHPELDRQWFTSSNYLVCLSVPSERELQILTEVASSANIKIAKFHEPDLNNELTAVVFEPGDLSASILGQLPLALKKAKNG